MKKLAKKYWKYAVVALATFMVVRTTPAPVVPNTEQATEQASQIALKNTVKVVVKLENKKGKHGEALCSGVIIGPNKILTAGHCVETEYKITNIWVKDYDGKSQSATVLKTSKGTDLALLGIKIPEKHWVTFSRHLVIGAQVIACGHPLGNYWSCTFGHVSALHRHFKELKGTYIQFDAAVNGGNSGGGLFNSKGELLGIVTMHETTCFFGSWSGLSLAVDMSTIDNFLYSK